MVMYTLHKQCKPGLPSSPKEGKSDPGLTLLALSWSVPPGPHPKTALPPLFMVLPSSGCVILLASDDNSFELCDFIGLSLLACFIVIKRCLPICAECSSIEKPLFLPLKYYTKILIKC